MPSPSHQSNLITLIRGLLRFFFWLLYNLFAWTYDWVAWVVSLGRWKDWIQGVIPYLSNEPILEVGHGPGHLQVALFRSGKTAFGLDLSSSMVKIAQRRLRREAIGDTLVQGTALHLPFPNEYFASIVATFPSEYIASQQSLGEIFRVLRPDGRLVILPFAWITGKRWLERLAAWLFQITGQAPRLQNNRETQSGILGEWMQQLVNTATLLGFSVMLEEVNLGSSRILVVLASKMKNLPK
jgi:ubiquinone/menaquinone biosynthesis C-methylase UbiE